MPIEIQGANAGEIEIDEWPDIAPIEMRIGAAERAVNILGNRPAQFIFNKDFQQVDWPDVPAAPPPPPRAPEPADPAPVEAREKAVFIDDMVVSVPAWARFVTQNTRGTIEAWEQKPVNIGKNYVNTGGLHKTILKVDEYEQILKAV